VREREIKIETVMLSTQFIFLGEEKIKRQMIDAKITITLLLLLFFGILVESKAVDVNVKKK